MSNLNIILQSAEIIVELFIVIMIIRLFMKTRKKTSRLVKSLEVINGGVVLHYYEGSSTFVQIPEERRQEMIDKLMGEYV